MFALKCTEGSRLMRILLLRISLLRFFKISHEHVAYAILCTLCYCDFWLMRLFPSPKRRIRQEPSVLFVVKISSPRNLYEGLCLDFATSG